MAKTKKHYFNDDSHTENDVAVSYAAEAAEENAAERGGEKSLTAFKTIREVADIINVPQHVLRFWESKFSQIKPLKRRGGRRYYRPEDIAVIARVKHLLYKQGYTIKGAKKALDKPLAATENQDATQSSDPKVLHIGQAKRKNTRRTEQSSLPFDAAVEKLSMAPRDEIESVLAELYELRNSLKSIA